MEPDQVIDVDRLPAEVGATVEMTDILLVAGDGDVRVGQPLVQGARVIAEVVAQGRDHKIVVFKYKAKTRYRRKKGHRQPYTRLAIRRILTGDEPAEEEVPKPRRQRARPAAKAAAPPAAEAPAKPRRRTPAAKVEKPKAEAKARAAKPKAKAPAKPRGRKRTESE